MTAYLRNPQEIYRKSFAIVREETDLSRVSTEISEIVIRLVHACGMPEIVPDIAYSDDMVSAGRKALADGKSIVTDVRMVEAGIMRRRLPASNPVLCAIGDDGLAEEAKSRDTTRSAIAIEKLSDAWAGGIVAIGSAPTALFRVLEMIDEGAPPPAVILGFPVGFVGAAESKQALIEAENGVPFVTLRGRRGGSALAAAAVNALAGPIEG
ncbi:MAG: precorrin-8X methylmutase [Pseudomonadota bacterium]|nr:precorrin-8X methylmutase [Pseudomonadota bacterium]